MTVLASPIDVSAAKGGARPRIALINQPFDAALPPKQTSLAIWAYQVARELADRCDVTVYGRKRRTGQQTERIDGVCYRHIPNRFDRRLIPWLERWGKNRPVDRPVAASRWYAVEYARRVASDLRRRGCDVAWVFNYSQFAPIIKRANPATRVFLNMQCEWASQFDRAMIAERLRSVDAVLGCSGYVADKVRDRFPAYPGICQAVYNGVNPRMFEVAAPIKEKTNDAGPRILFVGRISPEKGIHVLLDAFAQVLTVVPDATLDLVGADAACPREILADLSDDPMVRALGRFYTGEGYGAHVRAQAAALGIAERVRFHGFLAHAETAQRFAAAALLVNPSLSEAFGMSLAEGMAAGLPVVATRVGGMVEVVDDETTGLLVAPDDAANLATALTRLLTDAPLREKMGQAGRRRVAERFAWWHIADELFALATSADRGVPVS
jgi:glycosyltransferase involved in cell wall biosynthesis